MENKEKQNPQGLDQSIEDYPINYHLKKIRAIQLSELDKRKGNLMARVFLRATGAIRDNKGNYNINSQDLFAWFENLDYLLEKTEWDVI